MHVPVRQLIEVANAAPLTPQPKGKIKSQSSTTLTKAASRLHHMASFGAPSRRRANMATAVHNVKSIEGANQTR